MDRLPVRTSSHRGLRIDEAMQPIADQGADEILHVRSTLYDGLPIRGVRSFDALPHQICVLTGVRAMRDSDVLGASGRTVRVTRHPGVLGGVEVAADLLAEARIAGADLVVVGRPLDLLLGAREVHGPSLV